MAEMIPEYDELLPAARVQAITGLSRATVYRLMAAGRFPRPVHVGGRVLWPMSRVQAWIRQTIAEQSPNSHQPDEDGRARVA